MAEQKLINTRIALKIDTLENWNNDKLGDGKGAKLVLKRGEIGLCEIPSGNAAAQTAPTVLFKVGDGKSTFAELKWASALAADVYSWAKAKEVGYGKDAQGNETEIIEFRDANGELVHSINLSKFALNSELTSAIETLTAADVALGKRIDDVIADAYDDTAVRKLISDLDAAYKAADTTLDGKITAAQNAANKAQGEVDSLETVVSTLSETVEAEIGRVEGLVGTEATNRDNADKAIKAIIGGSFTSENTVAKAISDAQAAAEGKVTTLENGQVKTNKEDIATIKSTYATKEYAEELSAAIEANTSKIGADIAAAKSELKGTADDASSVATIAGAKKYAKEQADAVQTNLTNHINAYNTKVKALEDEDTRIVGLVTTEKGRAEAAEAALSQSISTEKSRAEGIEEELRGLITGIQDNIASGLHFVGVVEKLEDITSPVNGDICIVGTQEYIYVKEKNKDGRWEPLGEANAHASKTYVDNTFVTKETYNAKVTALEKADTDLEAAYKAADTALETSLKTLINGKVAQSAFDTLNQTVEGHKTSKLDKSVYDTHATAYAEHLQAQSAKDTAQDNEITAIKTSLATGTIHTEIDGVRTLAQKGVDDAATAQGEVDALEGVVNTLTTTVNTNKTNIEKAVTDEASARDAGDKALEAKIDKKASQDDLTALTTRVTTAEGKITTAEGNITTLQSKVTALEGTYNNAQVDKAISDAVKVETDRADAAEKALEAKINAYDARFGTKDDILVFDCGSSTTVI